MFRETLSLKKLHFGPGQKLPQEQQTRIEMGRFCNVVAADLLEVMWFGRGGGRLPSSAQEAWGPLPDASTTRQFNAGPRDEGRFSQGVPQQS